jgi:hypothetical protein
MKKARKSPMKKRFIMVAPSTKKMKIAYSIYRRARLYSGVIFGSYLSIVERIYVHTTVS